MSHGPTVSSFRVTASGPPLTEAAVRNIVERATRLKAASAAGTADKPLRGKNIAMLRQVLGDPPPLQRAAAELGAQVAQLLMNNPLPPRAELAGLAQMLGRLYDAVDCGGLDAALAAMLHEMPGITVYDGLGDDAHPAHALASLMCVRDDVVELADNHRFVLQALLISTLEG
ncbi:hypothetical protein BH10PSE18_BH10PSE18_38320 [soil metagenome]